MNIHVLENLMLVNIETCSYEHNMVLREYVTVSSTFQDVDFGGSL